MQMSLPHATDTLNAISRLHNYTINQWPEIISNAPIIQSNNPHLGYQPSTPTDMAKQEAIERSLHTFAPVRNVSMIRANLVRKIKRKGLCHPQC